MQMKRLLLLLLAPAMLPAQPARRPGPAGESRATPPAVNTSASGTLASNTVNLAFTAPAGQFGLVVHVDIAGTGASIATIFDCAGAGPCTTPGSDWFSWSD